MSDRQRTRPVVMVGLDGADWELIRQLCDRGSLPNLSRMLHRGCWGTLDSPADEYAGGVWPDFYTGTPVSHHGIYHNKLWRQDRMQVEVPTDRWLGSRPFHEDLADAGLRVCAIDLPMVLGEPRPLDGVYLGGWATHDLITSGSWPSPLWDELCSRFGKPRMPVERFGAQTPRSLMTLRTELLEATMQIREIACELLERHRPDFTCVVFGAAHRGGHYLWDASQVADDATAQQRSTIERSLAEVYAACDTALGALLERTPDDATVVAFAVHGMSANHGWSDLGAELVEALLSAGLGATPRRGILYRLRQNVPFRYLNPVLHRLPRFAKDGLVRLWSSRMYDWSTTPYFPLPMDQAGYVRINLAGRERDGIVEGGEAYRSLCNRLTSFFEGLRDEKTGERVISRVELAWQGARADDPARDLLPDLVVVWGDLKARDARSLVCDALPGFSFDVPAPSRSGRSGNHAGRAWFVADGPAVRSGELRGYTIRDLAPTVFALMRRDAPSRFTGRSIPLTNEADRDR